MSDKKSKAGAGRSVTTAGGAGEPGVGVSAPTPVAKPGNIVNVRSQADYYIVTAVKGGNAILKRTDGTRLKMGFYKLPLARLGNNDGGRWDTANIPAQF